ncbi:MAG: L,D-transpeptidase [Chitinophagaceae bacterium]|nr:L,D-transpeptidase [Chitinophagaceae bacterium]
MQHFGALTVFFSAVILMGSCRDEVAKPVEKAEIDYKQIVQTVKQDSAADNADSFNLIDDNLFDPTDSLDAYLDSLKKMYGRDSALISRLNMKDSASLKYNLAQLRQQDSTAQSISTDTASCRQIQCRIWARVSKKEQLLYLYIDGKMVDTFKVSTGDKRHETPVMDLRPSGPVFQKYTSRKFPGGNYKGLGNMPYVVFVRGGYALHGTTSGNIPKLGRKASHGCVRLHPDNAKIFNELVRKAGINNTWVTIEE